MIWLGAAPSERRTFVTALARARESVVSNARPPQREVVPETSIRVPGWVTRDLANRVSAVSAAAGSRNCAVLASNPNGPALLNVPLAPTLGDAKGRAGDAPGKVSAVYSVSEA